MTGKCETCRFWERGAMYTQERYGNTPERLAWSTIATAGQLEQSGQCRIAAPWRSNGFFPITYEFNGCGEHQQNEGASND